MAVGKLRVYLGAAPGVGKTYAMLSEGRRRAERGTRVVIGFVECHGRPHTEEQCGDLPVIPRRVLEYRGSSFEEMDLEAVLAARPEVVLVDELAHTNIAGSVHAKRWQDVDDLLQAGINVITTVNIQHLESLNDVVESITGVRQQETVPDDVVRRADQIELVDMSAEALRRRMAHGNIYRPEKVDAALSHYFRPGNLSALRELALLWLADRVDERLETYRSDHGISDPWPTRERVVVALTGGPEGETLLRRGARTAAKGAGGELIALYVARSDGLTDAAPDTLTRQRQLTSELGGQFHTVVGDDVAGSIVDFARSVNASRIVLGVSRHRAWTAPLRRSIGDAVVALSGDIDVHLVTHEYARRPARRPDGPALSRRRVVSGWLLAVVGPPLLTLLLSQTRDLHALPTELMLFLVLAVGSALVGGLWPAVVAAVFGSLLLNFYFTEPVRTFTIDDPENAFALVVFVLVAVAVSWVVGLAAQRTVQAAQARAEADTLSGLTDTIMRSQDPLADLLTEVRRTFGMASSALLECASGPTGWRVVSGSGDDPPASPGGADVDAPVSDDVVLVARGRTLTAEEHRLFIAFAAHAAVLLERARLSGEAAQARELAAGNRIRTALLAAVSHDLRTPLASIKAAISSLRQSDITWSPDDEAALMASVEESTDRLGTLIDNLLDMSRLQSDLVRPLQRDVGLDEVLPGALAGLAAEDRSKVAVADDLPAVVADPGLLERVLANLVENAVRHSPADKPVMLTAGCSGSRVEVRVVDQGRGVDAAGQEQMFEPFQRLGDAPNGTGVGLGLAVARGLTEAMGGTVRAEDTPGGGLTMVVDLPRAEEVER